MFTRLLTSLVLLLSLLGSQGVLAQADPAPPALPFPRIEVGAHTDRTVGLAVDQVANQIVSVSDDRTVRFWDAQTGRLANTIHVPMADDKDGELYALAIAPQSRLLVVGGRTGYNWDRQMSIYVFDLETRRMIRRIEGLQERVTSLNFSADEQRLAVALINGTTLMYDVDGFTKIASNRLCQTASYRTHFNRDTKLAVQCADGKFYVYDAELTHLKTVEPWQGRKVRAINWSPDAQQLAVSFFDEQRIVVLDANTFQVVHELNMDGLTDVSVSQLIWSVDGAFIYAAGDFAINGEKQLIRWDARTGNSPTTYPISQARVLSLLAMPDGGIAYSSLAHAIGKVRVDGEIVFYNAPPIISHYERDHFLSISADASKVSFALNNQGTRFQHFSIRDRQISTSERLADDLLKPLHWAPGMNIEDWHFSKAPKYNGKVLPLYPHQESNAFAISPTRTFFVLALDGELRRYHKNGELMWSQFKLNSVASVNISQDGKVIVAGMQDGSIRWFRADDGEEFFALFAHKNGTDWVAWVPPGFFIASPDGDKYIGWQLNNGADQAADFYSAWQFERMLYRPDIVQDYFDSMGVWSNSRQFEKFRTQRMRHLAPPNVELSLLETTDQGTAKIRISSNKRQLPIEQYTVFVNDLPVTPFNERSLLDQEKAQFVREHEVPLNAKQNTIRVEILTESSFQVESLYVESPVIKAEQQGDLYLLAIGVNELPLMPENSLNYAAQDAVAITDLLSNSMKQFKQVHVKILSDQQGVEPSKENILSSLSFLEQSSAEDTVILYIAAHGISNKAGDYFMVPRDGRREDLRKVIEQNQRDVSSLIRWDSFFEAMRNSAGRRMLIVDTCEAQRIKGNFDFGSLAKRSAAVSFGLLSASTGNEQSQEYPPAEQGLFTYGLIQALQGQADKNADSRIDLTEVYAYTKTFVRDNRLLTDLPQTPQLLAPKSLRTTVLNDISVAYESADEPKVWGYLHDAFDEFVNWWRG